MRLPGATCSALRARACRAQNTWWLVAALSLLSVPLWQGRAWNAVGPSPYNVLNPPIGYEGRVPDLPITAETWGASGVMVPFHARLGYNLRNLEAPRWNPYQGLGQPSAAQGEGSPYSPPAIVRALLPFTWGNAVTLAWMAAGAWAMRRFLGELGTGDGAATWGATAWVLSGAMTLHLARPNLLEQAVTIPILFWALARAIRRDDHRAGLVLAAAALLHLLGGFIQTAMLSAVLAGGFALVAARWRHGRWRAAGRPLLWMGLGNVAGCFFLLPLLEAMQGSVNKNTEMLAFIPMPYANLVAFFTPTVFGPYFRSWIPGAYPHVVDWNNLFAFSGCLSLFLIAAGLARPSAWPRDQWRWFVFFAGVAGFLLLRYVSFPAIGVVNLLPIFGRQSPKHAGASLVFVVVTAAALALPWLRAVGWRRCALAAGATVFALGSTVAVLTARQGGWSAVDPEVARRALLLTTAIVGLAITILLLNARERGQRATIWLAIAFTVGEGLLYLPMGTAEPRFDGARLALLVVALLAGAALVLRRPGTAGFIAATGIGLWTFFIVPHSALPANVDLTEPPPAVKWLRTHAGHHYRTFGLHPDSGSIWRVHDLSALGPLTPESYAAFLRLVMTPDEYRQLSYSYVFLLENLQWRYAPQRYEERKAYFDAAGVKYLVLDRAYFDPGKLHDDTFLRTGPAALRLAYEDERMRILESADAHPAISFIGVEHVQWLPTRDDVSALMAAEPARMPGPPWLEAAQFTPPATTANPTATVGRAEFLAYRSNEVVVRVETTGPGLLRTTELYDPGWRVELDGRPAQLLRVQGIFRGAWIPAAGRHEIRFTYRSSWETRGWFLAGLAAGFIVLARLRLRRRTGPLPLLWQGVGWSLVAATLGCLCWVYFKTPPPL